MAKRNFAALMLASIAALAVTNNARAQEPFIGVDGCAVLAQLVYAEVTAAAWYRSSSHRPWMSKPRATEITVCNQTTRTVSKAFTSAMTSVGAEVRWGYPSDDPGDYCWSGFLDQCYPDRSRLGASANTWSAVSRTILRAMPRDGYWHFERSHELVLERQYQCTDCHSAEVPFFPVNNRTSKLAQAELCSTCHGR